MQTSCISATTLQARRMIAICSRVLRVITSGAA
jgi:hypothetical protein